MLVRIRHDKTPSKRENWLLIKHRDEFATETDDVTGRDRSVASGRTMEEIAAGKGRAPKPFMVGDRATAAAAIWHSRPAGRPAGGGAGGAATGRSGRTVEATARTEPGKTATATRTDMPPFVRPQLCKSSSRPPSGDDWVHEIKLDGYRVQMRVDGGEARLHTRNGLDWTAKFQSIADAATRLPDALLDGEIVALDDSGAPSFAALQAALTEARSQDLVFFVFDLLFERGEDLRSRPLAERKQRLARLLDAPRGNARIRYVEHFAGAGNAVLRSACRMHLEGIVSKRLGAPHRAGRSEDWIKSKCRAGHEVVIGGWRGTATTLRSLIAGVYRDGHLVHVGQIGTGYHARNVPDLLARLRKYATKTCPFATVPRRQNDWNWVEPNLVAEIEFAGWTGDGMIRQSAFKGLRDDKPAREVVAEAIAPRDAELSAPNVEAAGKPASRPKSRPSGNVGNVGNVVMGVTISHPDKQIWPPEAQGPDGTGAVTKLDLARYLEAVGPWMIEHIAGRPCSVVRAPDGIADQQFFQRHAMPGMTSLVELTTVSGERKPYLKIDRVEGLIAMAQIAAVEFHPWNCAPRQPEVPGRLIFDLDPAPDVAFSAVIAAAREVRERIERLGLVAFCKTTGGKGLHVVTPLRIDDGGGIGWGEAKAFAQAVCTAMAKDSPDKYLVNKSKRRRDGRIYLDFLRNDRMATAVAPLSPRARPGAPVSMPIDWSQVRNGLAPGRFTIETVPRLLARSTVWDAYREAGRPLSDAIRKLVDGTR